MNDRSISEGASDFNIQIGKKVKARREELKLTQTKLAKSCGVTFQQIQKYEKGINGLTAFRLKQIANRLKVSVLYFYLDVSPSCMVDPTIFKNKNASVEPLLLTKEMEITDDQSSSR